LIKPYSTAIAKCFEDFFLTEQYIVIGVITKEKNFIEIAAMCSSAY